MSIRIEGRGESVELRRAQRPRDTALATTPSGSEWRVHERADFPAHAGAVESLLARLANLRSDDLVATEAESHARFGIGEGATRVLVSDESAAPLLDVRIASNPEGVGSYVQILGSDEVYRVPALSSAEPSPAHWIDTRLAAFDVGAVATVQIVGPTASATPLYLIREEDGRWGVAGESRRLLPAAVDPLLLTAANLYFDEVDGTSLEAAGLGSPEWSLRLELLDGEAVHLLLGPPLTGDVPRAVTRVGWSSPWVVRISPASARRLEALMGYLQRAGS